MGGGDMISKVTFEETTYNELPYKFEAGTPNVADVIGFGAAIDYIQNIGMENIFNYEKELLDYATRKVSRDKRIKTYRNCRRKMQYPFICTG